MEKSRTRTDGLFAVLAKEGRQNRKILSFFRVFQKGEIESVRQIWRDGQLRRDQ